MSPHSACRVGKIVFSAAAYTYQVGGDEGAKRSAGRISVEHRGGDSWAVVDGCMCATRDLEWIFEPSPSNREDDFVARTRFPFNEAIDIASRIAIEWEKHFAAFMRLHAEAPPE